MMEWAAEPFYGVSGSLYSKKSFLEFAESEADVYYCVEKDLYYMPGERKLFEYRGEFRWLPGKGAEADEKKREMESNSTKGVTRQGENMQMTKQEERQAGMKEMAAILCDTLNYADGTKWQTRESCRFCRMSHGEIDMNRDRMRKGGCKENFT